MYVTLLLKLDLLQNGGMNRYCERNLCTFYTLWTVQRIFYKLESLPVRNKLDNS